MKFSSAIRGTRAEKPASFSDLHEQGKVWKLALRPLAAMEEIDAVATAITVSKQKGSEPVPGKAIYDETLMAATLAAACVDPESPVEKREPFFAGGANEILECLDADTIASLHEQQAIHQEEVSPSFRKVSDQELFGIVKQLVEGVENQIPLGQLMEICLRLSPKTRLTCMLFMAALLRTSPVFKPPYFSPSRPDTESPLPNDSDGKPIETENEPSEKPQPDGSPA